jgi:hypothetical protein
MVRSALPLYFSPFANAMHPLTRRIVSNALLLAVSFSATATRAADDPALTLPAKDKFHLYLLIGQSNMAGRGAVEAEDKVPHPRTLKFTKDQTWAPAVDPLHFDKPQVAGVGLGSSFARVMADANPSIVVGVIPCAVGGAPLNRWQKGGDLYQQALARAQAAMHDGTLRGILWHQGEGDGGRPQTANSYGKRLARMVADLRADLAAADPAIDPQLPFVAGKLGQFLVANRPDGAPTYYVEVNRQLDSLPTRAPRIAVASSADLEHKGDQVHFDSPRLREFGRRYAAAMQMLQAADR